MLTLQKSITCQLLDASEVKKQIAERYSAVMAELACTMARSLFSGGKILLCGNGGSASDAQHIAAEFVGRFRRERMPLPSVALTANGATLTAIGNDYAFDNLFERQVRALGRPGDVLIGITTSGQSPNVIAAVKAANALGMTTVALTGGRPTELTQLSNFHIGIPSQVTARIQECHLMVCHVLCEEIDELLFPASQSTNVFDSVSVPKITTLQELLPVREVWRRLGKKLVWTNGCFDLMHVGHIRNLQSAKAHGDILVVGVNSDSSVQAIKGLARPVIRESDRAELVSALECVDHVLVFSDTDPTTVIAQLQPDVHCKGAEYSDGTRAIPEKEIVLGYGGTIQFLPILSGYSTTGLIEKIRSTVEIA